jgi:hypothetical protein
MDKIKWVGFFSILLMMGCAGVSDTRKVQMFDSVSRSYGKALRWSQFEEANAYRDISRSEGKQPDLKKLSLVKVTSYDVRQTTLSKDKLKAVRIVDIEYYKMNNVTVKTIRDREVWEYDVKKETWLLVSDFPDF